MKVDKQHVNVEDEGHTVHLVLEVPVFHSYIIEKRPLAACRLESKGSAYEWRIRVNTHL
jgi:hypothetical protein